MHIISCFHGNIDTFAVFICIVLLLLGKDLSSSFLNKPQKYHILPYLQKKKKVIPVLLGNIYLPDKFMHLTLKHHSVKHIDTHTHWFQPRLTPHLKVCHPCYVKAPRLKIPSINTLSHFQFAYESLGYPQSSDCDKSFCSFMYRLEYHCEQGWIVNVGC